MMTSPLVSVVLPTLNRTHLLHRAVASVLGQSMGDLELIVVDDGSTEDVATVVEAFADSRTRVIRHPQCRGVSAARNSGIAAAKGEYLAFQDSDDEWCLEKLEQQLNQIRTADKDVGLAICGMMRLRRDGGVSLYPEAAIATEYAASMQQGVRMNPVAFTQTWLLRRSVWDRMEGFETKLQVWEDWEALLRLCELTNVVVDVTPRVISYVTSGSLSANMPARVQALSHIIEHWQGAGDAVFLSRLYYLKARFQLLADQGQSAARSVGKALSLQPTNTKAGLLAIMLLAGAWLPRRYFLRRQSCLR